VAGAFDFLDDQVQGFGGAVGSAGGVVVEDLATPPGPAVAS